MKGDLNTVVQHAFHVILRESHFGFSCLLNENDRFVEVLIKNGVNQNHIDKYCGGNSYLTRNFPLTLSTKNLLLKYGYNV